MQIHDSFTVKTNEVSLQGRSGDYPMTLLKTDGLPDDNIIRILQTD